ncbi:MAG: thymidine kinase [Fusobacteriaceae bacterium]
MRLFYNEHMGWIEVITGSMFSGKSEELIKRLRRVKYANQKMVVFKHASDMRYNESKVASHSQNYIEAIPVKTVEDMYSLVKTNYNDVEVIGIDEIQFFGEKVVEFCDKMADEGKRVIVAGLDQDFKGAPFSPMDKLLARAEFIDKFSAICMVCGSPASRTQRLVNGEPAYSDDPIVMVGASESYEARCRKHHIVKVRDR